ncbi:FkbM family methyltransferase [Colwellia echini]|uniref:FkbM family methyltransferase n=1 Tax=Colwellia echini TaxID=1982103 RepID=A0ABY3MWK6_9GAMM|nr:FkbM family methyltransferase [Colwellia echini]TYK65593.1 FkbM family methyltransferase [Colwellia echini]
MKYFYKEFFCKYTKELHNNKHGYYDVFRTSLSSRIFIIYSFEVAISLMKRTFKLLTKKYITQDDYSSIVINKNNFFIINIDKFSEIYLLLSDDYSKEKYLDYIVFRAIGALKNRLPFDEHNLQKQLEISSSLRIDKKLNMYDLSPINYNLKFIGGELGIILDFILEQYAYKQKSINIEVVKDDVVIDCGGATGDTALYFYAKGAKKIYVYEFLPSSIKTINQQLLNNNISDEVEIINNAIWSESNLELSYLDKGNASVVAQKGKYQSSIVTLSIDDMVKTKEIEKIDFIKMDVEGAEVPALNGAYECIKKDKPKLAISVYHKKDDLITITSIIKKINPNYKLYFDYYTNTGAEAILYAIDSDCL